MHPNVRKLIDMLMENTKGRMLYRRVIAVCKDVLRRHLCVVLVPDDVCKREMSRADGDFCYKGPHAGRIRIRASLDETEQLSTLIFELANMSQVVSFMHAYDHIGVVSRSQFIDMNEKLETRSCRIHHRIAQWGIAHLSWDPFIDCYPDVDDYTDAQLMREEARMHPWHREYFGKLYDRIVRTY